MCMYLQAGGALGGGYYLGGGGVGGKLGDKSGVFTVSNGVLPGEGVDTAPENVLLNNFTLEVGGCEIKTKERAGQGGSHSGKY